MVGLFQGGLEVYSAARWAAQRSPIPGSLLFASPIKISVTPLMTSQVISTGGARNACIDNSNPTGQRPHSTEIEHRNNIQQITKDYSILHEVLFQYQFLRRLWTCNSF